MCYTTGMNDKPFDDTIITEEELTDMFGEGGKEEVKEAFTTPCKHDRRRSDAQGTVECIDCGESLDDMSGAI